MEHVQRSLLGAVGFTLALSTTFASPQHEPKINAAERRVRELVVQLDHG
jgi:hypothetical protein